MQHTVEGSIPKVRFRQRGLSTSSTDDDGQDKILFEQ